MAELASRQHGVVTLAQPRRLAAVFAAGLGAAVSHRTAADLLVDLADVLPGEALARAVNEAEVRRLFDARAVENGAGTCERPPRRDQPRPLLGDSFQPTRSALEDRFVALIRRSGLPQPRLNVALTIDSRTFEVDAVWPQERVIVELDGVAFHSTWRAFHADRARDLALVSNGYVVVRLTWRDVSGESDRVVGQLRDLLAIRALVIPCAKMEPLHWIRSI